MNMASELNRRNVIRVQATFPRSRRPAGAPRGLARFVVVIAIWLAAASLVVTQGTANYLGTRAPLTIASIAGWHSASHSGHAVLHLLQPELPDAMGIAGRSALEAWRRDPTNQSAIRTLWELQRRGGNADVAARLGSTARHLGWRDYLTQIFAARDAAEGGQLPQAMRHFSAALTTNRRARAVIVPVFVRMTGDSRITDDLARLIATKPNWIDEFNAEWVPNAPSPKLMADLSQRLDRLGSPVSPETRAGIIGRLVAAKQYGLAEAEYRRARPELRAAGQTLADGYANVFAYRPFDWELSNTGDTSAAVTKDQVGRVVLLGETFVAGPSEIARRMLTLRPGRYRILGSTAAPDGAPPAASAGGAVEVTCASQGSPLGRSQLAAGAIKLDFTIPESCPAVLVTIFQATAGSDEHLLVHMPLQLDRR